MKKHVAGGAVVALVAGSGAYGLEVSIADLLQVEVYANGSLEWSSASSDGGFNRFVQNEDGSYTIEGGWDAGDWISEWSFDIGQMDRDSGGGSGESRGLNSGFVVSNFNFTNNTGDDSAEFVLVANAFVGPLSAPTSMTGSFSGSLNSGNPGVEMAELHVPTGDFLYTAMADASVARTLVDDTFSTSTMLSDALGPFGFMGEAGPSVINELSIRHAFGLTDGDNVNLAGAFVVTEIPAPGAGMLFGLAGGLLARRRR